MDKRKIELTVNESLLPYVILGSEENELKQSALLLYPYIKNETISHGKAAEILGITKWELIEIYGGFGLPYFDLGVSELREEIASIRNQKDTNS